MGNIFIERLWAVLKCNCLEHIFKWNEPEPLSRTFEVHELVKIEVAEEAKKHVYNN